MKLNTLVIAALFLGACGIPDSKPLNEIDADTWAKICAKVAEDSPAQTVECSDGTTYEIAERTAAEAESACIDAWSSSSEWTDCNATFGDWVAYVDWEDDLCDPNDTPPNDAAFQCLMNAMDPM